MSSITSFVSELIRAANEVERLDDFTISRLLQRSITTIQDLRELVGIPVEGTEQDALRALRREADFTEKLAASERAAALLSAAEMIRTLYIVVDSGIEIRLEPGGDRSES